MTARHEACETRLRAICTLRFNYFYFAGIAGAVFSAGAGGSAGIAPASASGRAGCGGVSWGRCPVVDGSTGAAGLLSAPGVDCNGGVAWAMRDFGGSKVRRASADVDTPAPVITTSVAIARRVRNIGAFIEIMASTAGSCAVTTDAPEQKFPRENAAIPWCWNPRSRYEHPHGFLA